MRSNICYSHCFFCVVSALNRMDIDMKIIDIFMVPRGAEFVEHKKNGSLSFVIEPAIIVYKFIKFSVNQTGEN